MDCIIVLMLSGTVWKVGPQEVRALYAKAEGHGRIQSSARHEEPCVKSGGPPPKAKYYPVTDSE